MIAPAAEKSPTSSNSEIAVIERSLIEGADEDSWRAINVIWNSVFSKGLQIVTLVTYYSTHLRGCVSVGNC